MIRFLIAILFSLTWIIGNGQVNPLQTDPENLKVILNGAITGVDPESATIPESLVVEISGSGTHFAMGTGTTVWFSQGSSTVWSSNTVELNNTSLQAQMLFTNSHDPGYYDVNAQNETDGLLVLDNGFFLNENPNPPLLIGVSPGSGQAGEIAILTITGEYTHFNEGYNYVSLNKTGSYWISATYITVLDGNTMEAEFHIPTFISTGIYNLQVYNSWDGNMGVMNAFEVLADPDPPYLATIEPDEGSIPETLTVTISGVNTHFNQGTGTFVNFNQGSFTSIYPQSVNPLSETEIEATFTFDNMDNPGYYDVKTYSGLDGNLYLYNAFYLGPNPNPPALISIDPDQAEPGQTLDVQISGQNTNFSQGTGTVAWLTKNNTYIFPNYTNILEDELLDVNFYFDPGFPAGLYTVNTLNNTDGHLILEDAFNILDLNPQLLMLVPDQGYVGDTVSLEVHGEETHFLSAAASMSAWLYNSSQVVGPLSINPISNELVIVEFALTDPVEPGFWDVGIDNDLDGSISMVEGFEVLDTISGIPDRQDLYTLQIAPNPSNGIFNLSFQSSVNSEIYATVLDQAGTKVSEYKFEAPPVVGHRIDLTNHPAGVYFIQIKFKSTSSAYKVVVSR